MDGTDLFGGGDLELAALYQVGEQVGYWVWRRAVKALLQVGDDAIEGSADGWIADLVKLRHLLERA